MSVAGPQKFFARLFIALAILIVVILFLDNNISSNRQTQYKQDLGSDPYLNDIAQKIDRIEQLNYREDYQASLELAQDIEQDILSDPRISHQLRYQYFFNRGDLHWNLWHFVEAEKYWSQAMSEPFKTNKKPLSQRMQQAAKVIANANKERNKQLEYNSAPGVGPAADLKGKIAVAYIFVKLGRAEGWSLKDRQSALQSWSQANSWLSGWAKKYHASIEFSQRTFIIDKQPELKRLHVRNDNQAQKKAPEIIRIAMNRLGANSVTEFSQRIKQEENADQVIVLFHINQSQRSFALYCKQGCNPYYGEFAFIYEKAGFSQWQSMQYALAHEVLHLFGADDLYNINGAKYYATQDIMNYPSKYLDASLMEALTAYSVGLTHEKPETPFPVKTYH